jgi:excisionase family DNA binding protein
MTKDRITVQEAAKRLRVKDDAIRKRIQRGTLQHEKDPDGRVYVYLDAAEDATYDGQRTDAAHDANQDAVVLAKNETISELRDQIDFLRRELERKDAILMSLTQRIPELEAPPPEPTSTQRISDGSESVAEDRERPPLSHQETSDGRKARPWWRRLFEL